MAEAGGAGVLTKANQPQGIAPTTGSTTFYWGCLPSSPCDTALEQRRHEERSDAMNKMYRKTDPHVGTPAYRNWGPSSRHPGVVIHGYADAHTDSVNETINRTCIST